MPAAPFIGLSTTSISEKGYSPNVSLKIRRHSLVTSSAYSSASDEPSADHMLIVMPSSSPLISSNLSASDREKSRMGPVTKRYWRSASPTSLVSMVVPLELTSMWDGANNVTSNNADALKAGS